jgi:hypothetical protein
MPSDYRERMKQAAIADRCGLKRAAEVACEFVAGCSSPPHQYSIAAPTARKIFDRWCKKAFATKSALFGPRAMSDLSPDCAPKRTSASAIGTLRKLTEMADPDPSPFANYHVIVCYGGAGLFDKHLASTIHCVDDEIIGWRQRREQRRRARAVMPSSNPGGD